MLVGKIGGAGVSKADGSQHEIDVATIRRNEKAVFLMRIHRVRQLRGPVPEVAISETDEFHVHPA